MPPRSRIKDEQSPLLLIRVMGLKTLGFLFLLLVAFGGGVFTGLYLAGESPEDILTRGQELVENLVTPTPVPREVVPRGPTATPIRIRVTPSPGGQEPTPTRVRPTPTFTPVPSPASTALEVYNTLGLGLRVRSQPRLQADNIVGKLFDGTRLTVQEGQTSADGHTWRPVRLDGWVAAAWLSPSPSIGTTVDVQGTEGVGLRVRTSPRITPGNILGKVYDATRFQVLEGPRAADGHKWWRMRLEGWAASEFMREPPAFNAGAPTSPSRDRRFIVMGGMCTSTGDYTDEDSWMPGLKRWLAEEFALQDFVLRHPDDQIIEFSYSPRGWTEVYSPDDTFRLIPDDIVQNLKAVYDAYPTASFDIIAHSLGGAVALYFLATPITDSSYKTRTNSVVTVDSPINGIDPGELNRRIVAGWPGCPDRVQIEILTSQLEPGRLVPNIISRVTEPGWESPRIATVTNMNDLIVPTESATFSGPSVYCTAVGAGGFGPSTHSIILKELQLWFQDVIKAARAGGLFAKSC